MSEQFEIGLEIQFSQFLRKRGAIFLSEMCKRGVTVCQRQTEEVPLVDERNNVGHFSLLGPIFPPIPAKNWAILSLVKLFFRIGHK